MINPNRLTEIWKEYFDPYLMDMEGFEEFVTTVTDRELEDDPKFKWDDLVPPCVRCVKHKVCQRGHIFREGGEKVRVVAPGSHVWKPLEKPNKGTKCEGCGTEKNLMAYRAHYNKQTLCKTCLEGFTPSKLACKEIVHRN